MPTQLPNDTQLLEASWEVCNKVGGIHTVLTSKIELADKAFLNRYLPIGPFLGTEQQASVFKERPLPVFLKGMSAALEKQGVSLHFGTWLTDGEPNVLLIGWDGLVSKLNQYKSTFWDQYQLDTLGSNFYDIDQPLLWSIAVGIFATTCAEIYPGKVILHAHEWLTGGAILIADQKKQANLRTVFTTHATVLGRALSSQNIFIYDKFGSIDADQEARNAGVITKHQIEKLAATRSTIFTTVSKITAEESAAFLSRKPEVVVENGLSAEAFPTFDGLTLKRSEVREAVNDFVSAYFFPSYRFDITKTHYQFTMGRYELHNKGYDLYVKSLGELNKELKTSENDDTIIAFFLVPGDSLRLRPEVTYQLAVYRQVRHILAQYSLAQQRVLFANLWENQPVNEVQLIPEDVRKQLHQLLQRLPNPAQPANSPFDLRGGENDALIQLFHEHGLHNRPEDQVKALFLPVYFDGFDGIFNMPLYELVTAFDLGVFPSLYEPWGYTPMESLALGIPAITSNVAGFGRAITTESNDASKSVMILDRSTNNFDQETQALTNLLQTALAESERERMLRRMSAYMTVQAFDWRILYQNYLDAYQQALA